jgi:glutaredoxin
MSEPLVVTLFTRPGCHLCEDAKALLDELAARYPHRLEEVNIDQDASLHARYHLTIPVIRIGDTELEAPITKADVEGALRALHQPLDN